MLALQLDWREKEVPKKGTHEWDAALRKLNAQAAEALSGSKNGGTAKGSRASNAAGRATSKAVSVSRSSAHEMQDDKGTVTSAAANTVTARVSRFVKEVPQALGQAISERLPGSSKKQNSGQPAASAATISGAISENAQKAQDVILAMSPGKASGTGKRAVSAQEQSQPPAKRTSRHASTAGLQKAAAADGKTDIADVEGKEAAPQKASFAGCIGK